MASQKEPKTRVDLIINSALAQKKVNRPETEISDIVKKLFKYFDYFNSLTEDDTIVFIDSVKTLDQIPVLSEFAEFILPASVKLYAGNRRLPELLVRVDKEAIDIKSLSYSDYITNNDAFRSLFKKSGNESCVTLASLKKELSLNDVMTKIQIVDNVNYDSDPYIPVRLIDSLAVVIDNKFLQDDAWLMVKDFCAKIRF